jgi:hypothetical protein
MAWEAGSFGCWIFDKIIDVHLNVIKKSSVLCFYNSAYALSSKNYKCVVLSEWLDQGYRLSKIKSPRYRQGYEWHLAHKISHTVMQLAY